jgi:hypothetical protein
MGEIEGEGGIPPLVTLPVELIARGSTAAPRTN